MERNRLSSALPLVVLTALMAAAPSPRAAAHPAQAVNFIVDSTLDEPDAVAGDAQCISFPSNKCTLRAAIQQANALAGDHEIRFSPDLPSPAIVTLSRPGDDDTAVNGDLDIAGHLAIIGTDTPSVTIDGNGDVTKDRVFQVLAGASVTLSGIAIRNGSQPSFGGGLYNLGRLTIQYSLVSSNTSGNGGAIANSGTLTVVDTSLVDNIANNRGGALFSDGGTATLSHNIQLANNKALYGGGAFAASGGKLSLDDATFDRNTATTAGGGLYNQAKVTLSVTNTVFSTNTVGDASTGDGGGVFNQGAATFANGYFSDNVAGNRGGAIFNTDGATLALTGGS
jgi:CSLREA domain-containing protein